MRLLLLATVPIILASCKSQPPPVELSVAVAPQIGSVPLRCGVTVTTAAGPLSLRDLRLFVSDVRLTSAAGAEVSAELVPDGRWQSTAVALLDFEDATGDCEGDAATNTSLRVRAPAGDYTGVRFTIGVPFAQNHANPALAEPPLTTGAMQWGWRAGYKFLRFEARLGADEARVHLGSTACQGSIGAITDCDHPNRGEVSSALAVGTDAVVLDVAAWLPATTDRDCMGDPGDPGCATAYAALRIK